MSDPISPAGPVVITGGAGFVGKYLLEELQRAWPGTRLIVWDRAPQELSERVEGVVVDITDPQTYIKSLIETQPAWIIHLAAVSSVPAAMQDSALAERVNIGATAALLENIEQRSPLTQMFVTSTSDIYGQGSEEPLSELPLAKAKPRNPYAETKAAMERVVEERFSHRVLRVRSFPHIGPGQAKGFVSSDFAFQIAAIEAGKQQPVMLVGNLEAARDFTDVRDVVRAYRLLLERGIYGKRCSANEQAVGTCGVYHVASGKAHQIQELLDILLAKSSVDIAIERDSTLMRPSDTPVIVGDASKLQDGTGWRPEISFEQTLSDVLDYWREEILRMS